MKTLRFVFSSVLLAAVCAGATGCHTAHHVAADTTDLAAHSVHKTAHAMEHGARKLEKHL